MTIDTSSDCLAPYQVLSQAFNLPTKAQQQWWHYTAPVFVKSMVNANYDVHAQYSQLAFFHRCVLPYLGGFPGDKAANNLYKSGLSPYGLPFEFSLNLPEGTVRYSYEPIGPYAGTKDDPFNIKEMWNVIQDLVSFDDTIDTTWFRELVGLLLLSQKEASDLLSRPDFTPGGPARGQYQFAVDMKGGHPFVKAYFFTTMKTLATGIPADQLISKAVRALDHKGRVAAPLAQLEEYTHARGAETDSTFMTAYLGCDMVDPQQARLKVYGLDREVTFDRLIDLWTMGGRIPNDATSEAGINALRELWDLLSIPAGTREMKVDHLQLGEAPKSLLPLIVNYTLLPSSQYPEPQVYLVPFGMPDGGIADALTRFFGRMGWDQCAQTYKKNLVSYYPHQDFTKTKHVQEAVSFSYKNGKPYLSVYISHF
ncbi:tryptophan dimethylallyltransferase [Aspergillus varians]